MQTIVSEKSGSRIYFLDNLKAFLVILVVFHHTAITYGAGGSWYYLEHTDNETLNTIFSLFTGINQTYFMSLFFLIAGYFTPTSYDKKGAAVFLKDRFWHLGIPLILFVFTLSPLVEYIKYVTTGNSGLTFWEFYKYLNFETLNLCPGPLWFVETLLIFSFVYTVCRLLFDDAGQKNSDHEKLTNKKVLIFTFLLSVFTFMIRIASPTGYEWHHLQLAYFPHYICFYVIGIISYRKHWADFLSDRNGKLWIFLSLAVTIVIAIIVRPLLLDLFSVNDDLVRGGFSWESMFISALETFMCVGISIAMLYIFKKRINTQKSIFARLLSENAFVIYIVHAPVIVLLALALNDISFHPVVKFAVVAASGFLISLLISNYLIRKLTAAIILLMHSQ